MSPHNKLELQQAFLNVPSDIENAQSSAIELLDRLLYSPMNTIDFNVLLTFYNKIINIYEDTKDANLFQDLYSPMSYHETLSDLKTHIDSQLIIAVGFSNYTVEDIMQMILSYNPNAVFVSFTSELYGIPCIPFEEFENGATDYLKDSIYVVMSGYEQFFYNKLRMNSFYLGSLTQLHLNAIITSPTPFSIIATRLYLNIQEARIYRLFKTYPSSRILPVTKFDNLKAEDFSNESKALVIPPSEKFASKLYSQLMNMGISCYHLSGDKYTSQINFTNYTQCQALICELKRINLHNFKAHEVMFIKSTSRFSDLAQFYNSEFADIKCYRATSDSYLADLLTEVFLLSKYRWSNPLYLDYVYQEIFQSYFCRHLSSIHSILRPSYFSSEEYFDLRPYFTRLLALLKFSSQYYSDWVFLPDSIYETFTSGHLMHFKKDRAANILQSKWASPISLKRSSYDLMIAIFATLKLITIQSSIKKKTLYIKMTPSFNAPFFMQKDIIIDDERHFINIAIKTSVSEFKLPVKLASEEPPCSFVQYVEDIPIYFKYPSSKSFLMNDYHALDNTDMKSLIVSKDLESS